jgi:hypothetical protein
LNDVELAAVAVGAAIADEIVIELEVVAVDVAPE